MYPCIHIHFTLNISSKMYIIYEVKKANIVYLLIVELFLQYQWFILVWHMLSPFDTDRSLMNGATTSIHAP